MGCRMGSIRESVLEDLYVRGVSRPRPGTLACFLFIALVMPAVTPLITLVSPFFLKASTKATPKPYTLNHKP